MQHWLIRGGVISALTASVAAQAAGIDCTRARSPTEKAICATPGLRALDQAVADATADAFARAPEQKDAMRADLLRWLKQRDAACALPSAEIPRCLAAQLTNRLAALAPPAVPEAPPSPVQTSAPPAIPAIIFPPGAATLDQASLPAAGHAETLLHVASPGRFTIAAHSATGASLQLVDIMAGPGGEAGAAGAQDGRLDPLLDVGIYKLRLKTAKGASGIVTLSVVPFHDAAPPAALPPPGVPLAATLHDGEQRAFWLAVPASGEVRIEAAGRSLADLRLWRDGRELAPLDPAAMRTEPTSGHPLTDLRLEGRVEPGTYLAIAYGGPALPWTDNDASQPFHLRGGASPALAEGWAGGTVGPFGSEVFTLPAAAAMVKLSLPTAASAELRAGDAAEILTRASREPLASLNVTPKLVPTVEVRANAGQAFTLQAFEQPTALSISRPGAYWMSAMATGAGGDEVPPGFVLERTETGQPSRVVASTLPQIGPGAAWHTRFNLRGETTMLVQNTGGGRIAVRPTGVAIKQDIQPVDLAADYYQLSLTPQAGAVGSLDLVVGPPGANAPLAAMPPDPVIPLGIQTVQPGQSLSLTGPSAPGLQFGLSARPVPVALAEGPLTVTQLAGTTVAVPVSVAPGGSLAVSEVGGGPVAFGLQGSGAGGQTVIVPIADHARTIVLAWRRPAASPGSIPAPQPQAADASIAAGTPVSFDLARGQARGFSLTVPEGALYRLETLGRLHTAGRIASAFSPLLGEADANGVGQNMLLQQTLRAGRYRVDVTAKDSAGHLALSATPAPTLAGATLTPGGSIRASLPAGSAAAFPLVVTGPGERYRLEVASLGAPWQGRIEDAQGWPLARTGPLDGVESLLPAGSYRLAIAPDVVARQVVARLMAVAAPAEITGHGPHALPFDATQSATWREPDGRDPRTPDTWTFSLAGTAEIALVLGEGMTGELHRLDSAEPPTHVSGAFNGSLTAGHYELGVASLGRNDRLAYTVGLSSKELQPGAPRTVTLPSSTGFAIAQARVVSLTTFGNVPVKAVLRRADGSVVARFGARADDWNVAASRLLDAGAYTLDLDAASPPNLSPRTQPSQQADDSDSDAAPDDGQPAQASKQDASDPGQAAAADDDTPSLKTELRLALPDAQAAVAASPAATPLGGAGVHVLSLEQPAPGTLVLAQAASPASLVLALERQTADGWQGVASDEGTAPVGASPADGGTAAWRVEAWTVDGGAEPIRLAARVVEAVAQPPGNVVLAALDSMAAPLAIARVGLVGPTPVSVSASSGLLAGGWPGQALANVNGAVMPEGNDVWLLGRDPGPATVAELPFGRAQALVVRPGQAARLPAAGSWSVWRADGGFGQPELGGAAGIAKSSAVARANAPVTLRNASSTAPLRVALRRINLKPSPARILEGPLQATLQPGVALPLTLPGGGKAVQLALGAGIVMFADGVAAWAGDAPLARTLTGNWTELLLVNIGPAPAAASVAWQPAPPAALRPGMASKRFFGAAGSFELPFDAAGPGTLGVAGDAALTAIAADGAVARGREVAVAGAGRVVVGHGVGPVAVWLATGSVPPWPDPAPQAVQLPTRLALAGPAMALAFDQDAPGLLHVSTTAPVFASLAQAGRTGPPRLFPAGAELHMTLAPGPAKLLLVSPTDGPLSGSVSLAAEPVTPAAEGLGAAVTIAPGGSAAFGFSLAKAATVGVGIRADPDRVTVRLLDAAGSVVGEGVAQLRSLAAGRYVIEAQALPDGTPIDIRPAIVGITPRGSGPPPEVAQHYLELAGLKPQGTAP